MRKSLLPNNPQKILYSPYALKIKTIYNRYFPYISLILAILTIIFWKRGFEFIGWAMLYIIFIGITTVIALRYLQIRAEKRGASFALYSLDFINQNLYQDLIIFLIPFYYLSTTLLSKNIIFLIILIGAGVLSTFDNLYRKVLQRNRYTRLIFYSFNIFAFLNLSFPVILGIKNIWSLYLSGFISILMFTPLFIDFKKSTRRIIFIKLLTVVSVVIIGLYFTKGFIPPAPMNMTEGVVSKDIDRTHRLPVEPFSEASIKDSNTIYCYTSIFAPKGVKEKLWHVWGKDGNIIQRIPLETVGGRKEGFRTWSKKSLSKEMDGRWTVDIITDGGQLIGRVRFNITP